MQCLVVIEKDESSYGAYVPDLPGCIAVGETHAETSRLIHKAIEFHVAGLFEDSQSVPPPASQAELVNVAGWMDGWSLCHAAQRVIAPSQLPTH